MITNPSNIKAKPLDDEVASEPQYVEEVFPPDENYPLIEERDLEHWDEEVPDENSEPDEAKAEIEVVALSSEKLVHKVQNQEVERDSQGCQNGKTRFAKVDQRSLADVVRKHHPLPPYALFLGICQDNLPLLLDLFDPAPGSVLIIGDDISNNRLHLQAILASACLLNTADQVKIDLVSQNPQAFTKATSDAHYRHITSPFQMKTLDILGNQFNLVEKRRNRGSKRPIQILAIEEVDILVEQLASHSLAYLRWLLRRGPSVCVWVFATLSTARVSVLDWKTIQAFDTRLFGRIDNSQGINPLSKISPDQTMSLVPGMQACMRLRDEVVSLSIPAF